MMTATTSTVCSACVGAPHLTRGDSSSELHVLLVGFYCPLIRFIPQNASILDIVCPAGMEASMGKSALRVLGVCAGALCAALGILGMFLPVLPTTPFLLLAGFLFARSSKRMEAWLTSTKAWKTYVLPFKVKQAIPRKTKARILIVSFVVMAISAFFVRNLSGINFVVWLILGLVYFWLLYLMFVRIPTEESKGKKSQAAHVSQGDLAQSSSDNV